LSQALAKNKGESANLFCLFYRLLLTLLAPGYKLFTDYT
jgi:hypothetical protein